MAAFRTVICGSPQPEGKCAAAASHMAELLCERFPEDQVRAFTVATGTGEQTPCPDVTRGRGLRHIGAEGQDPNSDLCHVSGSIQEVGFEVSTEDVTQTPSPCHMTQTPSPCHIHVHPCIGCNRCAEEARCFIRDDMEQLLAVLQETAELYIVCPVFFAGPPAQMKAVLDRMQPLYYTDARTHPKRPANLLVVGGGGDPHGFEPLVGIMRSALSVAGFSLDRVEASIGEDVQGALSHAEALCALSDER